MKDSSFFITRRKSTDDCGVSPDIALYYPEGNSEVPTVTAGTLHFLGAKSDSKALGVGWETTINPGVFAIPYLDILTGGAGYKVRSCTSDTRKIIRFKCCETLCHEQGESLYLQLEKVSTCEFPEEHCWVQPYFVDTNCGCDNTCCERLTKLADLVNKDSNSPATASVEQIDNEWWFVLTAKELGRNFEVKIHEGLKDKVVVSHYSRENFSSRSMIDWFDDLVINDCSPNQCLPVVELWYKMYQEDDEAVGRVTSNYLSSTSPLKPHVKHVVIVFHPSQTAQRTALINLLNGGGNQYIGRLTDTPQNVANTNVDAPTYQYCIAVTDNGDAAAEQAVVAEYVTGVEDGLSIARTEYIGGVSYYTLRSLSDEAPEAAEGRHTIKVGICNDSNLPCSSPSGCPDPEENSGETGGGGEGEETEEEES